MQASCCFPADSTRTVLALCRAQGLLCHALSFHYGQRHAVELQAAARVAQALGAASHRVCRIDLGGIGRLGAHRQGEVPRSHRRGDRDGIPVTYVPARNTLFVAHALAVPRSWARAHRLGINALDFSGYLTVGPNGCVPCKSCAAGHPGWRRGRPVELLAPLVA